MTEAGRRRLARWAMSLITSGLIVALGAAILSLPTISPGLTVEVNANLDHSGVQNPVTAVLLNFRAYDTLLEVTVLLLAVMGARNLAFARSQTRLDECALGTNPLLRGFVRVVAPVIVLLSGYYLWLGGHGPGGAFQAGALLAALGTLLLLSGIDWTKGLTAPLERLLLVAGLGIFLAASVATMSKDRHWLEFSPHMAKWFILLIEAFATISIAAVLLALYCGGMLHAAAPSIHTDEGSAG